MANEFETINTEIVSDLTPFSDPTPTGSYAAQNEELSTIYKSKLTDLMKTKDSDILRTNFNGVGGLAKSLQINLDHGINGQDRERRIRLFDSNAYKQQPPKGLVCFLVEAFKDLTKLIQLLVAAVSLGFSIKENGTKVGWSDGSCICVAVLVIALSAVINFIHNKQFDELSKVSTNSIQIDVLRDKGRRQKISIFDVVVGDVVVLNIGDQIPADGLFIDGHSLVVDESSMTGESDHIQIDAIWHPFLISGSKVVDGHARMLVLSVGMNTAWGKMMSSKTDHDSFDKQTPLQSCLSKLTNFIGLFVCLVALVELIMITVRCFMNVENGNLQTNKGSTDIPLVIRTMLAMAGALLLVLTVTLIYSTKGMIGDQVMVRKLPAIETMGSIDVICTQKTGILTMNDEMEVTKLWIGLDHIEDDDGSSVNAKVLQLYHQAVGLNTTGCINKSSVPGTKSEYCGSSTEKALLSWAEVKLGMDIEKEKLSCTIIDVDTFDSEKKGSGVLIRRKEDNTIHVHWKGAAEIVLAMCSSYYQKSGLIKSLSHDEKTQIEKIIQGMASSSLRCIAFAHKQIFSEKEQKHNDDICLEGALTLLGIVGMKNPCKPGVKEDITTCRSAGVEIKMITGDNIFTAKAIATEVGILDAGPNISDNGQVIEGKEFCNYTEEERMDKVDSIRVMARASPSDKLLMVKCLKKKGRLVAVTGHSTSDVPALKEADIGVSMGIQGTEVAKESSDIVILDDSFGSIFTGLLWSRCVYNNIQKLIQFQVSANVAALVINFISYGCGRGVPLTTVQMSWVNLVMVIFGALALATEIKPTNEVKLQKPFEARIRITNIMLRNILAQYLYQIVILLIFWFNGTSFFNVNDEVKDMIVFNTFILCQVFNLFNCRKLEKMNVFEDLVHKKMTFLGIVGVVMVAQVVMVEFLEKVADTQKLNMMQWGICITFASLSLPIGWFVKLIPVPDASFLSYI